MGLRQTGRCYPHSVQTFSQRSRRQEVVSSQHGGCAVRLPVQQQQQLCSRNRVSAILSQNGLVAGGVRLNRPNDCVFSCVIVVSDRSRFGTQLDQRRQTAAPRTMERNWKWRPRDAAAATACNTFCEFSKKRHEHWQQTGGLLRLGGRLAARPSCSQPPATKHRAVLCAARCTYRSYPWQRSCLRSKRCAGCRLTDDDPLQHKDLVLSKVWVGRQIGDKFQTFSVQNLVEYKSMTITITPWFNASTRR